MYRHIKKPIKKSLTDDLSKGLLEIECESNPSIKSKRLKWIDKKITPDYKEKNTRSKIKPMKTGKKIKAMYCLGRKDYTHNFKPQEKKKANKMLRKK